MKRFFRLFFTLITYINLFAQTNKVELKIISSETGYSLTPEHLTISNTNEKAPAGLKKVGNYYTANLPAGQYMISASKEGYSACESYFEIKGNDVKYDIFLDPVSKNPLLKTERIKSLLKNNFTLLLGYVVDDETGEPLNSVLVKDESTQGAVTNSAGYFEFYLPGVCEKRSFTNLTFSKPGYSVEEYKDFELFSNIDFEFTVRLKREKSQLFIQNHKLPEPVCGECNNKGPMLNPPVSGFVLPVNIRVGRNCTGTNCTYAQIYSLETYCKYVLPAEIYACWGNINGGMNSLQACAVAVRTYGVYHVYNPINPSLYDICDNTYCQYMGNVTSTNTSNAVDNTFRYILVNSGGVVRSEYSAENNNKGCGNGYSGTGSTWPCIYDPVCTNGTPNGHGRGLCQWGTVRWATGTLVTTSSPCSAGVPHAYGTMTWQQILNHYYNVAPQNWTVYFGITATMITSSCLPQAANPCSTITITNSVNATSQVTLMLGASIAPTGTTNWISDPVHDVKLTFNQGTGTYNRSFTIPCSAQPGTYDLLTAVWYDKDNNNQINTGDFVVNSRLTPAALTISPVGIKIISSDIPKSYRLYQNFPNPFNPVTQIRFNVPLNVKSDISNVKMIVYDISGKEVVILINEELEPGKYSVDWDASSYPSGAYFYKLSSGDFVETKKMVLIK